MSKKHKKIIDDALEKEGNHLIIYVCFWTSGASGQDEGNWHDEIGMYIRHDDNGIWIDRIDTMRELQLIWEIVGEIRIISKKESVRFINQLIKFIRTERDVLRDKTGSFDEFISMVLK